MSNIIKIPDIEYKERIQRAAKLIKQRGLDLLIVNSSEADFANVRYFSGFWPLFEFAGVVISANGDAALISGPESGAYANDVSKIEKVFQLYEYRETADPSYPEVKTNTFSDVFKAVGVTGQKIKIGIASYLTTTVAMLEGLKAAYPEAEIMRADDIMVSLRKIKSENELACMREGLRIAEIALQRVVEIIRPGMTELQVVGEAQKVIYENGAEYESFPVYLFSEKYTRHAISRASHRIIQKGDIVQLGIGGRVDGYSPSLSCPISIGKISGIKKEIAEFGLTAHNWTLSQLKAGVNASEVAKEYIKLFEKYGFAKNYLYGPCHGTGMLEVEQPWMETSSDYTLEINMTFEVDTFVTTESFGVRWETGAVIGEDGCILLSKPLSKIYEI